MQTFDYHRPATLKEAAALASRDDAKLLAGGQSLVQAMKLGLSSTAEIVDLGALKDLAAITIDGDIVTIGAMARHADVAESAHVRQAIPALAELAAAIGDRQVRNLGTLGGSIANNDPAADYPAAVLGLGATIVTTEGQHDAERFFRGIFDTALKPGEIVTAVKFPKPARAGYAKFRHPASRFALVGVFVAETSGGLRVAVTGAGPCVFRVTEMEQALAARFAPESVAGIAIKPDGLNSDIHAAADYRAHLVTVMAKRAIEAALATGTA